MLIKEFNMDVDLKPLGLSYMASAPGAPAPAAAAPAPAAAAAPATVLLVNAAGATPLGPEPQRMTCPSCHNVMQTRLELRSNKNTHLIALVLCVTGLICLVPLPYCLKSCRSLYHYCSCCNQYLGKAAN
ncbi:hypothetical protein AWZ03_010565 [Drosophila navojoa]|uniref:LITAF domain-containing protein n=1 Tax=Drosophila navojoa TaxID=7232 RepID=A0A484B2Q7_DRONA|nr:lipopolysaccharide-induced tumor necrosis factor-alpha factor homolog [Drosophila navojoa]TDG43043.1 hypothetical protein AWZ03_010565 [Drosophila navojoa]